MGISVETLAVAKKYTKQSIEGITGTLAGKNATIESITDIAGGHRVTFKWTADNGDVRTQTMDVMDGAKGDKGDTGNAGLGIKAVNINAQNHLIITYDDDSTYDAGELPGGSGEVISVNGKKGVVNLDANDVGALPDDTELFSGDYNDLDNLPDLTNFITNTVDNLVNYYKKTETYTKIEVDNIANTIKNGRFEAVTTLPTTDIKTNVIYLVPKPDAQTQNIKDEYINLDGTTAGWEKIGDTEIDLSGYVTTTALNTALDAYTTTTDLTALLADKVDKVTGKGLSTNDYANTDKELVDSIPNLAPISLVKDTVGWIGKNLLKNEASTLTTNGITWTVNDDGTILINGTNTDNSYLVVNSNISLDVDTEYILSGNTTENADEWYLSLFLQVGYEGMTNYQYIFNNNPTGVKFKLRDIIGESNLTSLRCYARVGIRHEAQTVDNVTFYPMIRRADITDDTYEPYHESVETMYEEEIHGVNLFNDGKIEVGKAWNGDTNANRARNIIPCEPNSEYIVSMNGTNGLDAVFFSVSASIPPASQTAITSFPYTIRTGASDRYITLGFNKTDIVLSDVTALKIMLRKADIEDSTYRPYNPQAIQNQLNDKGVLGAKNLIGNPEFGRSGSYYTVQDDNSVVFNGTPSANLFFNYGLNKNNRNYSYVIPIEPGKSYIVSGCPEGGNGSGSGMPTNYAIRCYVQFSDESLQWLGSDFGKGVKITVPSDAVYVFVQIVITAGTVLSDVIFRPMIRLASDPDDTYQPFVMTNKQLTDRIKTIVSEAITEAFSAHATKWHDNADDCNVGFERTNNYRTSNMPTTGTEQTSVWYNIMTVREGNNPESVNWGYGFQIAVQTTTNSTMGDIYVRAVNGGATPTWSEWKKLN